jgi:hypothetical protein
MDRCVLVHRCKRTGAFLLQPVDTARGHGVSINLYREVPTDAADESLGETVIDLLARSGPTGAAFAEATPSSGASRDEETERISGRYGVDRVGPTSVYARWFLLAPNGFRAFSVKNRPLHLSLGLPALLKGWPRGSVPAHPLQTWPEKPFGASDREAKAREDVLDRPYPPL